MDTEVLARPTVPVTARPKTTADILEAAAMVIEEFGWVQGGAGNERIGFCAWGAINYVVGDPVDCRSTWPSMDAVRDSGVSNDLIGFNDTPGRQQYEVTAALREAAKRERAVTTRSAQDGS